MLVAVRSLTWYTMGGGGSSRRALKVSFYPEGFIFDGLGSLEKGCIHSSLTYLVKSMVHLKHTFYNWIKNQYNFI